jgi:hypothetical protein|tara:strand:- start:259 stop:852 length:594 start_codon:yes stop_codon:yes gene_type:complete
MIGGYDVSNHESPISINSGSGTLAKVIVSQKDGHWSIPEGTILASRVDRLAAFVLDVIMMNTVLVLVTKAGIFYAWNVSMWVSSEFHYSLGMAFVIFAAHWLYWRWTGIYFSRSFGQKLFGLAIVADDGSEMTGEMWDKRVLNKIVYLIPIIGWYNGIYDLARIEQRHTHQSNIDLRVNSIVVKAYSLPPFNREHIK